MDSIIYTMKYSLSCPMWDFFSSPYYKLSNSRRWFSLALLFVHTHSFASTLGFRCFQWRQPPSSSLGSVENPSLVRVVLSLYESVTLFLGFCGDDVLDQDSNIDVLRRRLWTRHSTAASWFDFGFWVLFHDVVSFYQIIIVVLSLIMSLFRITIAVVYCPDLKCLSFLYDIIYVFSYLDGCSFS